MGFGLRVMRLRSLRDELLQVLGDLLHQGFEFADRGRAGQQPAADFFLDLLNRLGTVDFVGRVGVEMGISRDIAARALRLSKITLAPKS